MTNDRRQAWTALALLLGMNLLNYVDRQVLAAVEPEIEQSLFLAHDPHDPNVQTKMGLLASAFMISYMLAAPLFGLLAERWPRWKLLAVGAVLWSLASGASGLATGFAILLALRCLGGRGRRGLWPGGARPALGPVPRGRAGADDGLVLHGHSAWAGRWATPWAASFADLNPAGESWRWAFYAVVPPGLLVALCALVMREPVRGAADRCLAPRPSPPAPRPSPLAPPRRLPAKSYLVLLRTPSLVLVTLGMTAMCFAMGGLSFWMPKYLKVQQVPDVCGLTPVTFFGLLTAAVGLVATLAGGWAGDRLRGRWSGSYFLVSGAALLACVPCTLALSDAALSRWPGGSCRRPCSSCSSTPARRTRSWPTSRIPPCVPGPSP